MVRKLFGRFDGIMHHGWVYAVVGDRREWSKGYKQRSNEASSNWAKQRMWEGGTRKQIRGKSECLGFSITISENEYMTRRETRRTKE
jgi:hypothetical protein